MEDTSAAVLLPSARSALDLEILYISEIPPWFVTAQKIPLTPKVLPPKFDLSFNLAHAVQVGPFLNTNDSFTSSQHFIIHPGGKSRSVNPLAFPLIRSPTSKNFHGWTQQVVKNQTPERCPR